MPAAECSKRSGKTAKHRGFCAAKTWQSRGAHHYKQKNAAAPLPAWSETLWKKIAVYSALIAAPGTALLLVGLVWYMDTALRDMEAAMPDSLKTAAYHAETAAGRIRDFSAAETDRGRLAFTQMPAQTETPHEPKQLSLHMQRLHKGLLYASFFGLAASLCAVGSLLYFMTRDKRHRSRYQTILAKADNSVEHRVRHRTAQLEAARQMAEKERRRAEFLLQDSSHRIGNSLAGVSSLLGLQLSRARDESARRALLSARDRVLAVSCAHRRLRLNKDMETASAGDFLSAVIHDMESGLTKAQRSHIRIETHFERRFLPARDVTTLGVMLSELLINAVKHAFPDGRRGTIRVSFGKMRAKTLRLIVEDDGIGFSAAEAETAAGRGQGLGRLILTQLAGQFGAAPHYAQAKKNGKNCGSRITIALPNMKTAAQTEEQCIKKAAA